MLLPLSLVPNWPSRLPLGSKTNTTFGAPLASPVDWTRKTSPWALMAINGAYHAGWPMFTVRIHWPLWVNSMYPYPSKAKATTKSPLVGSTATPEGCSENWPCPLPFEL